MDNPYKIKVIEKETITALENKINDWFSENEEKWIINCHFNFCNGKFYYIIDYKDFPPHKDVKNNGF